MKKNKLNNIGKGMLIIFIFLVCLSNISAFAVSSTYWSGYPLKLAPGEKIDFPMILQNVGGNSELKVKAIISSGSEILKLTDPSNTYIVPVGERTTVNLEALIPSDAKPGQIYNVKIDFTEVVSGAGGTALGSSIGQSFNVIVTGRNSLLSQIPLLAYILTAGIVILIITFIIFPKMKKGKKKARSKNKK